MQAVSHLTTKHIVADTASRDGVLVQAGDSVSTGQAIGLSGETGYTSEPHLHFAVFNTVTGRERKTIPIEFQLTSGQHVTPQEGKSY